MKGIDPWSLPSYRFFNLIIYRWTDGMDSETLEALEMQLSRADEITHPFFNTRVNSSIKPKARKEATRSDEKTEEKSKIVGHISKPATPSQGEEPGYRPPWWRGDDQNYVVAKKMMVAMPQTLKTK